MSLFFNKVTIIGVGLIGGSIARVLKAKKLAGEIHGAGRSRETLEQAIRIGVIDHMGQSSAHAVEKADLVVLATPVGTFASITAEIAQHLKKGAILTDVGSIKGGLVRSLESMLPAGVHYVPAHPIAGRERHGVAESTETLFRGTRCIVTPTPKTDPTALEAVKNLWTAAEAKVVVMDPDRHDNVFAAVSHMPHVAAFAMMCAVAELETASEPYLNYSGAGFKDFTRIAASSPEMWRDICLGNAKNVVEMIDRFEFSLNRMKKAIHSGDGRRIEELFRKASDARRGMH